MTHFINSKQALMENVSFQDLTPLSITTGRLFFILHFFSFLHYIPDTRYCFYLATCNRAFDTIIRTIYNLTREVHKI